MSDIFISYARNDRKTAQQLAKALEAEGWSVWWDTRLKAGEVFDDVIAQELAAGRCVVVLWSKASVERNWVRVEAREGLKRRVLVPVRIEDVEPPLEFGRVHVGDLIGWKGQRGHPGFKQLMADVTDLLGASPQKASAPPPADKAKPEPAPSTSDYGPKGKKTASFLKTARSKLDQSVAAIKRYCTIIAEWPARRWHLTVAGGLALLILGGVGYSIYVSLQPEPPPPSKAQEAHDSQEAACQDQEIVHFLFTSLEKTGEAYQKGLIGILDFEDRQKRLLNDLARQMAVERSTEACLSQGLKRLRLLYREGNINFLHWDNARSTLWKNLHNLLLDNSQTHEEVEHALIVIKNLYNQKHINILEYEESRKALSEKIP